MVQKKQLRKQREIEMRRFYEFQARLYVSCFIIALAACGSNWKATAHVLGDRTLSALELASTTADNMVIAKTMTPLQRQTFAKEVMVPATTALEGAIQSVIAWQEGEPIPENVSRLVGILFKAVDDTAKTFGASSELHNVLLTARNRANGLLAQVQ